jgi:hypothetical protein
MAAVSSAKISVQAAGREWSVRGRVQMEVAAAGAVPVNAACGTPENPVSARRWGVRRVS